MPEKTTETALTFDQLTRAQQAQVRARLRRERLTDDPRKARYYLDERGDVGMIVQEDLFQQWEGEES